MIGLLLIKLAICATALAYCALDYYQGVAEVREQRRAFEQTRREKVTPPGQQ